MAIARTTPTEKELFQKQIGGTSHTPTLYKMANIPYQRRALIFIKYVVAFSSNCKSIIVSCPSSILAFPPIRAQQTLFPLSPPNLSVVVT
jgi:hypothetical protein